MKKKIFITIAVIIAIVIIAIVVYQYPKAIHREMTGYEISHCEDIPEIERTIVLDGWMKNNLFSNDQFRGKILIDEVEIQVNNYIEITHKEFGEMVYSINDNGDYESFGMFYASKDLSNIMILVNEKYERGASSFSIDEGSILIAPADTVEEAIASANKMLLGTNFTNIHITKHE